MEIKVMTFNTLHCMNYLTHKIDFDIMADTKYNQLQLYFEGIIFNYKGFEKYTEGKNPVTAEYIKEIKNYLL